MRLPKEIILPACDYEHHIFEPAQAPRASRLPPARSRGSSRGAVVHPKSRTCIVYESSWECKLIYRLLARTDVVDVWDQPPKVTFKDFDGKKRDHTFDFLVTFEDGFRIAVAFKPFARVEKIGFLATLKLIASQLSPSFADAVRLVSESDLPKVAVANYQLLHLVREDCDPEADKAVADLLDDGEGPWRIADLVERSGREGAGFNAIARLIGKGALDLTADVAIDYRASVRRGAGLGLR